MFTGIVQGRGVLRERRSREKGMVFVLEADFALDDPSEGESIAVNGVCLTAREINGRRFAVDVSPETLARSSLGGALVGRSFNLERALRLADRLGGHLVSGHVDDVVQVLDRRPEGDFARFVFSLPPALCRYVVEKGSVTLDGVSLTVNTVDSRSFAVAVIPHTLTVTTLGALGSGDRVNLELDIIGKYVEKLLAARGDVPEKEGGISAAFLASHGFLR